MVGSDARQVAHVRTTHRPETALHRHPPTPVWRAAPPPHPVRDLLLNTAVALAIAGLFVWLAVDIGIALTSR